MTLAELNCSIQYRPSNSLHFHCSEAGSLPGSLKETYADFTLDWRRGWLRLAAEKVASYREPTLDFWQTIASYFLNSLSHLPPQLQAQGVDQPENEILNEWLLQAPPMKGGEYLTVSNLENLWEQLNHWYLDYLSDFDNNPDRFFETFAPLWQKVGRVCLHLAENRNNPDRPFAFLATYATELLVGDKLKYLPLSEALKRYSGSNNRQALVKLLTPVQRASEKCKLVEELLATGELYQPLAWTPSRAHQFLVAIPELEECGLTIRVPNWWKQRTRPRVSVTIGSSMNSNLGASALLDFDIKLALGDETLSEEELEKILATNQKLAFVRGNWIEVDKDKLQQALNHWKRVQGEYENGLISFNEGMRILAGASFEREDSEEEQNRWSRVIPGKAMAKTLEQLRKPPLTSFEAIRGLQANLRPYQLEGVNWLNLLTQLGLGACLADDMGLGKTVQILSLLLLKDGGLFEKRPSLLVVPASLLKNWQREADKFTPSLNLLLLHPSELKNSSLTEIEEAPHEGLQEIDLVVTTYSMVTKIKWLTKVHWETVILDEAQAIKNSGTQQTKAVKTLNARSRIGLTGTPIENRLSDLWSLFDFLNPGLLGSPTEFKDFVTHLQTASNRFEPLRKLTSPYILRRMKTDPKVIADLPDKIESTVYCSLTAAQSQSYQSVVDELKQTLEVVDAKNRRGVVLKALLNLKQICNHPDQYSGIGEYASSESGKFQRLREICEELSSRQEKVLVFTQFKGIIPKLESLLEEVFACSGLTLHGGTAIKARASLVEQFQNPDGPPFFIISLRAGGTGLTLTEASHVIHFDRWWNPAVENQATDRAFRIGQKKNVIVHKFVTRGTVEEKIDEIIASKQKLALEILTTGEEHSLTEMSNEELLDLITLDINRRN